MPIQIISDLGTFAGLLQQGKIDINAKDDDGTPLLSKYIIEDLFDQAKLLILAGAKIDEPDQTGRTPIMEVILSRDENYLEFLKFLIAAKANLDAQDETGKSALIYAVATTNYAATKLLINGRTNLNIKDKIGQNALNFIQDQQEGSEQIKDLLIESGLDPKYQTPYGSLPVHSYRTPPSTKLRKNPFNDETRFDDEKRKAISKKMSFADSEISSPDRSAADPETPSDQIESAAADPLKNKKPRELE